MVAEDIVFGEFAIGSGEDDDLIFPLAVHGDQGGASRRGGSAGDAGGVDTFMRKVLAVGKAIGISAEAADIVLLADDVTRVATAIRIGRRATHVARQSIMAGLALSGVGMVAAALGYIPPTIGAVLQEAIDVAVIVNALRASRG